MRTIYRIITLMVTTAARHCETFIKKIKQHKMTMPITNNEVIWLNMLHFSGLLRHFAPRNDETRQRHCELAKQSRETEYQIVAETCHCEVRSNPLYWRTLISLTIASVLFFVSCDDEYGARKESTPVIESASVNPANFTFGHPITLNVLVTDPATSLTELEYRIMSNGKIITSGSIPIGDSRHEVSEDIDVPLVSYQPDNAPVTVTLTARNVLKGFAEKEITGLTGSRPAYSQLYLVTEDGSIVTLTPQATNKDRFEATGLTLDGTFNFKIAEKLTSDRQIDYEGAVWGNVNGRLAIIDSRGESSFTYTPDTDYTQSFLFDNYAFSVTVTGSAFSDTDIALSAFAESTIDGEAFLTIRHPLEKDREYSLFGKLADNQIVYNLDFFERTAVNKVRFLGETGTYTLYYNTYRQHVVLGVDNPAYPDYMVITGGGIGYPTKVSGIDKEHTWWGFGNVRNFILMRKIATNVFQATLYIREKDDSWVGFKPYENTGWGGDGDAINSFSIFTATGEDVLEGTGNWLPKVNIDTNAVYRLTINWAAKTVHVEKIIL